MSSSSDASKNSLRGVTLVADRRVNLLSLDGGGVRGYSELLILESILEELREIEHPGQPEILPRPPCEVFDLIGGTGTGGVIAILLGRLRMSTRDAIAAYKKLCEGVFKSSQSVLKDGKFNASDLERAIKGVILSCKSGMVPRTDAAEAAEHSIDAEADPRPVAVKRRSTFAGMSKLRGIFQRSEAVQVLSDPPSAMSSRTGTSTSIVKVQKKRTLSGFFASDDVPADAEDQFYSEGAPCRVFVTTAYAQNMEFVELLRSYRSRGTDVDCTIWQAARATTAAPGLFERLVIHPAGRPDITFIYGGFKATNPAEIVLREASEMFKREQVSLGCLLSIGAGYGGPISISESRGLQRIYPANLVKALEGLATQAQPVHERLVKRFKKTNVESLYARFNLEKSQYGEEKLLTMGDGEDLEAVETFVKAYLHETDIKALVIAAAKALVRVGDGSSLTPTIPLARIAECL